MRSGSGGINKGMVEMVKVLNTGPRIGQRRLLFIILALVIAALCLSAYVQSRKIDDGQLFCVELNQRTKSVLVWDGEGCLMKGA